MTNRHRKDEAARLFIEREAQSWFRCNPVARPRKTSEAAMKEASPAAQRRMWIALGGDPKVWDTGHKQRRRA